MNDGVFSLPICGHVGRDRGQRPESALPEFIVGPENRLVEVAVQAVLAEDARNYFPIVFYGPTGTGKSHLALGLAAEWKSRFRGQASVCSTAVDFARHLADAIETQTLDAFRGKYRRLSLLVLEDVERLAEKPAAQRELVHTLDALEQTGAVAVVTSSLAPQQLQRLPSTLQSRLAGGLTVPLALPGLQARLAVLHRFSERRHVAISAAALRRLAEGVRGPVPELLGALLQVQTMAHAEGRAIDETEVDAHLACRNRARQPSLQEIAARTAAHFSLRLSDLRTSGRRRSVVAARDVAMYLARKLTGNSLQQIGRYFGLGDHTTVSHGCRKAEQLVQSDPAIREAVFLLGEQLQPR